MKPIASTSFLLFTLAFLYASGSLAGTVTDIDGNVYKTVTIGTQVWMAENLRVTHYRNGDSIPNAIDPVTWRDSSGAYCDYDNNSTYSAPYGRLYNWYVIGDSRGLAPAGWHVATDAEWQTLIDFLGGEGVAGGKLKEAGIVHWDSPNTAATNESGFSALPGGFRNGVGDYAYLGFYAEFWSSTESSRVGAWSRDLSCDSSGVGRWGGYEYGGKEYGNSVRCVKDN